MFRDGRSRRGEQQKPVEKQLTYFFFGLSVYDTPLIQEVH